MVAHFKCSALLCTLRTLFLIFLFLDTTYTSHVFQNSLAQEDAETILDVATKTRKETLSLLQQDNCLEGNTCLLTGYHDHSLDIFQLLEDLQRVDNTSAAFNSQYGMLPNEIRSELASNLDLQLSAKQQSIFKSTLDVSALHRLIELIQRGLLNVKKSVLIGLLQNFDFPTTTPDVIIFSESISKHLQNDDLQGDNFAQIGEELLPSLLRHVVVQNNETNSHILYQLLQMISSFENVDDNLDNLLLIMKPDEYPSDVIKARDEIIANGYGTTVETAWCDESEKLLALLTELTTFSNDHPLAVSIHLVFAHFRMKYFAMKGLVFHPRQSIDIAFLLNSFLNVKNQRLIIQTYAEFLRADFPWQQYLEDFDYAAYSSPRSLFTEMLRAILKHPEALKTCDAILFNYFINDSPKWVEKLFPYDQVKPLEIIVPTYPPPKQIYPSCEDGNATLIIEPDCLIESLEPSSSYLIKIVSTHIAKRSDYPQETRREVLEAFFNKLKTEIYKDKVLRIPENLPFNENSWEKVTLIYACPKELEEMEPFIPEGDSQVTTEDYNDYQSKDSDEDDNEQSCEDSSSESSEECIEVSVIEPKSILEIIAADCPHAPLIREIVLWKPLLLADYSQEETREKVLKAALLKHMKDINDELLNVVIPEVVQRLQITSKGQMQPEIDITCEKYLNYNETTADDSAEGGAQTSSPPCTEQKTINPYSLIEIMSNSNHIRFIQHLIFMKPISAKLYKGNNRATVWKALLLDRLSLNGSDQNVRDSIERAIERLPINDKGKLPVVYTDMCQCPKGQTVTKVVSVASLLEILQLPDIETIKELILAPPIPSEILSEGHNRTDVLKMALLDLNIDDANTHHQLNSLLTWLPVNEKGAMQPLYEEKCIRGSPNMRSQHVLTCGDYQIPTFLIAPESLLEAINEPTNAIKDTINEKYILQKKYFAATTRKEILQDLISLDQVSLNEKADLSPKVYEKCLEIKQQPPSEAPTALDVFKEAVKGLGETPIPCDNTTTESTMVTEEEDCDDSEEETTEVSLTEEICEETPTVTTELPSPPPTTSTTESICEENSEDLAKVEEPCDLPKNLLDSIIKIVNTSTTSKIPVEDLVNQVIKSQNKSRCNGDETDAQVIDIESLFDAINGTVPVHVKSRMLAYKIPIELNQTYVKKEVVREILQQVREDLAEEGLASDVDQLISSIREDGSGLEKPAIIEECLPSSFVDTIPECQNGEEAVLIINPESLFDAFSKGTPKAPFIKGKIMEYVIPYEEGKTKGNVLKEILLDIKKDNPKERLQRNINILLQHVLEDGAALDRPGTVYECVETLQKTERTAAIIATEAPLPQETTEFSVMEPVITKEVFIVDEVTTTTKIPTLLTEEQATTTEIPTLLTEEQAAAMGISTTLLPEEQAITTTDTPETLCDTFPNILFRWPLLLHLKPEKICIDRATKELTIPTQIVNITNLLQEVSLPAGEKYVLIAQLAGLDTFQKIANFNFDMSRSKKAFTIAVLEHIGNNKTLSGLSDEAVEIKTICSKELKESLPISVRDKRFTTKNVKKQEEQLDLAQILASRLITKHD